MTDDAHYAHCAALLRERDRDLWLACLFAPRGARKHIHAIHAFALELADVSAKVSQPLLGEMRLRWWTDALEGAGAQAGEGARAHPVADALLDTAERFNLPRNEFITLADAHIVDLYDDPLPTVAALEDYCRTTVAAPLRWSGRILGADLSAPGASAFDDAGVALGITRILCALPQNADGQTFLPTDALARHGVTPES
ncbi:MAG: squalene/phytoene synthase family protein, partial [Methylocystis sp.]|nr:squalene/phytoene synthase family protein [Methylocystis sp.]